MSTGFIIDEKNQLKEIRTKYFSTQSAAVRLIAKIISYIFHPVFVPLYIVLFMVYVHPYLFIGLSDWNKTKIVMMAVLMFAFFPIVTVLLLKALDFIRSVYLTSQKDRIIPLIACMTWYFWIWFVWNKMGKSNDEIVMPDVAVKLAMGIFISSILGLMANIIMKISLHAISAGVMLAFIFLLAFTQPLNFGIYISVALFIAGTVCTSRFIVSDHVPIEVYGGLAVGIISQLLGFVVA
jgi:hypothetical protein